MASLESSVLFGSVCFIIALLASRIDKKITVVLAFATAFLSIIKRLCDRCDVVLSIGPLEDGGTRAEVKFPA